MTNVPPQIDFTTFILSISSAAYMGLGLVPMEPGRTPEINMDLAQNNIDLLDLLWTKTTGNRTPDEEKLLSQLLFETRLRFVEAKKQNSVG